MSERAYLPSNARGPRLIAGTLAVALLVFGSRWAAYLGVPPLFLTDVLLLLSVGHTALSAVRRPEYYPVDPSRVRPRTTLLLLLFTWALLRFLVGGDFSLTAARDAVPYIYAGLGLVAAWSVYHSNPERREGTKKVLLWALGLHAVWFFIVRLVVPGLPATLPTLSAAQGLHVLSPRADIDTALAGVFAAWLVIRLHSASKVWPYFVALVLVWVAILDTRSRAGLISAFVVTALGLFAGQSRDGLRMERKAVILAVAPFILALFFVALPSSTIGARLAGFTGANTVAAAGAIDTANARNHAWKTVIEYTESSRSRSLIGVGFGPNFLSDSGASLALIGTSDVGETIPRSPHNYVIGTLARLGIVGAFLCALVMITATVRSWYQVRKGTDDLALLAGLLAVSIIPIALLGVVLESPFGAVPFFWCSGILAASNSYTQKNVPSRRPGSASEENRGPSWRPQGMSSTMHVSAWFASSE